MALVNEVGFKEVWESAAAVEYVANLWLNPDAAMARLALQVLKHLIKTKKVLKFLHRCHKTLHHIIAQSCKQNKDRDLDHEIKSLKEIIINDLKGDGITIDKFIEEIKKFELDRHYQVVLDCLQSKKRD